MPKAILEFDLNEERDEFQLMLNANKWYSVVWDIDQHLRSKTKYASDDTPNEIVEVLYQIREELRDIMNANGVSFE